ncbi:SidA/IucD/PvdA family monooxygenase [Micromonospora aurantiaca (nom. illeg.)]
MTRKEGVSPTDDSPFWLELFSPDFVDYFQGMKRDQREA